MLSDLSLTTFLIALATGILPSLFWLFFWLQEDRIHPEPRSMILRCFVGGMASIIIVFPLQWIVDLSLSRGNITLLVVILWALIEELAKFFIFWLLAERSRYDDEPIDPVIYMIAVALGFAAIENVFYVLDPASRETIFSMLSLGNSRFIGSTLLHVLSSATLGSFIGFSFYKTKIHQKTHTLIGIFFATLIHAIFNIGLTQGENFIFSFLFIWVGIVILIVILEKLKFLKPL